MKRRGKFQSSFSSARRLARSERGAITVVAIVFFATLIALGGLAIDLGRVYGVHGQMQAYVDNSVLAGAAELNGENTSVTRALRAIIGDDDGMSGGNDGGPLINGFQNFAEGNNQLSIDRVVFLSALGDDLDDPTVPTPWPGDNVLCTPWENGSAGTACTAAQSRNARFVEVVATERQINYFILPIVDLFRGLGGAAPIADSANVSLMATAGFKRSLCNTVPLMMCNPNQIANPAITEFTPLPGQQFLAKSQGAPDISPGNFGPLAMWGNGANAFAHGLASVNPNLSCFDEEVPSEPGAMQGPIEDAMNTRMDLYPNGSQFDSYPPALNVTKGLIRNPAMSCAANNIESSPDTMPFPRHPCFGSFGPANTGRCASGTGGTNERASDNADWDRDLYANENYGDDFSVVFPSLSATATRYQVYQAEQAPGFMPLDGTEVRGPTCGPSGPPDMEDRRKLLLAIVNCLNPDGSEALPGGRDNFPFIDVAEVFLTEPVGNDEFTPWEDETTPFDIWIEMIGKADANLGPAPSGVLHTFPILYR